MTGGHSEPTSPPEGRFGAETTGTLKRALQYYLEYEREFVSLYFPRIAERNYVTLSDISDMSDHQADALRPLLADSVRYLRRKEEKGEARAPPSPDGLHAPSSATAEVARKAQLWAAALQELCARFQLADPLEGEP
jgi:hypothetical protein